MIDNPIEGAGPLVVIVGNCQAESLRIMMGTSDVRTVRVPAVHELVASDLTPLGQLLALADVFISQPVQDDYHGLPIGTSQMRALLRPTAAVALVPVIRFAGLYPTQVIVRPPSAPSLEPPVVPYHDLATLAEAAGAPVPRVTPPAVRAIAALSLAELERREQRHDAVAISDMFISPDFSAMRTINHPGNTVFAELARRVRERVGLPAHSYDPGRPILANIHAPREQAVIDAFALSDQPTTTWRVDGHEVDTSAVQDAHRTWYRRHPEVVAAGVARHADALRILQAG